MARESLFNILHNEFEWQGMKCLDLFAGTGAISLELSSRGVESIIAVERNKKLVASIQKNCRVLGCDNITVQQKEVQKAVKDLAAERFDLIFADPPYHMEGYNELIESILRGEMLSEIGILIVEHDNRNAFSGTNRFREERVYGNVRFTIFE